jgi:isocitrate lyase
MQYVGQTRQQVSKRMNSHKFDINNFSDPIYASGVATHFNSADHDINDFSFLPIDIVSNDMDRLLRETSWIHRLNTVYPSGMNTSVLFNV